MKLLVVELGHARHDGLLESVAQQLDVLQPHIGYLALLLQQLVQLL